MKRIFLILMLLCVCNLYAQNYYTVTRVGSNDIRLKGHSESLKKGDRFLEESEIDWSEEKYQWFDAIDKSGQTRPFNNKSMQARGVRSILNYLKRLVSSDGFLHSKSSDFPWTDYKAENSENYPEKRLAVVIGNANYDPSQARILMNPSNDAHQISNDLKSLGFDVICLIDGNTDDMRSLISALDQNKKKYELVLLYYSGHAFQYNNSLWLQPVNANVRTPKMVEATCVNCNELLSMLSNPNKNTVVVIDGCRDEKTNFTKGSDKKERLEPNKGMLLAFATQPETEAIDIVNENDTLGPYAQAFSNSLKIEGLSLSELFDTVRFQVYQHTSKQQLPIYTNNTTSTIYLHKPTNIPELSVSQEEDELVTPVHLDKPKFAYQPLDYIDSLIMNDPEACYFKGLQLHDTLWLLRAGELGCSDAYVKLGGEANLKSNFVNKMTDSISINNGILTMRYYLKAAELGNSEAQLRLGLIYSNHDNQYEAGKWYLRAAENGLTEALLYLADWYYRVNPHYNNDVDYYLNIKKLYEQYINQDGQDLRTAYHELYLLYKYGFYKNVGTNLFLANTYKRLYRIESEDHSVRIASREYLKKGEHYYYEKNYLKAIKYLKRASKEIPNAHYYLANIYYFGGNGVEEDLNLSLKHYLLVPLNNYVFVKEDVARSVLNICQSKYFNHDENDRISAIAFFKNFNAHLSYYYSNPELFIQIGDFFKKDGAPDDIDYVEALYWYKKAVFDDPNRIKYCHIGEIYENGGYGIVPNIEKALIWYRLADDKAALKRLGFSD